MLEQNHKRLLSEVGSQLLTVLEEIAELARAKLSKAHPISPSDVLAVDTSPMVGGRTARLNLVAVHLQDQKYLKRLEAEPFVARIVIRWDDEEPPRTETFYVTRASAACIADELIGIKLATYAATLGRLAEFKPGDSTTLIINRRQREISILERVIVSPVFSSGQWDAIDDSFEFESWHVELESVRRFLEQQGRLPEGLEDGIPDVLSSLLHAAEEATLISQAARRKVIDRIALRDQPILDRYQGEVFRMPLDRRLVLLGPPGTGKTTTLVRRLAQKLTSEALTSEESKILASTALQDEFLYSNTWAMFSPTELLKLYLRDSFNREGIPATDNNLKTWDKERLYLGKSVFRLLRSAEWNGFQLDDTSEILADISSAGVRQFYQAVASYVETEVLDHVVNTFNRLQQTEDHDLRQLVRVVMGHRGVASQFSIRELSTLLQDGSQLQPAIRHLDEEIKQHLHRLSNRLLYQDSELLSDLILALPSIMPLDDDVDEEEDTQADSQVPQKEPRTIEEKQGLAVEILLSTLQSKARAAALGRPAVGGRAGRVVKLLGGRLPSREMLSNVGTLIVTRSNLKALIQSPRLFVMGIPQIYKRFRKQNWESNSLFKPSLEQAIKLNLLSPEETDALILIMLRNARRLLQANPSQLSAVSSHDWVENIKSQYLTQVFVDEATDFSAVQLACTIELSDPRLRSWFACGDFHQRITSHGIQDTAEIDWVARVSDTNIELRRIDAGYRQSRRLWHLATTLSADTSVTTFSEPGYLEDVDVWPLLAEQLTGSDLANWLTNRIVEIERAVGKLPSIAIFVENESLVDRLAEQIHPLLIAHNIPVVGCKDGRVVGDSLEVRIFDVRHIKGLEFEAVFFVGIDRLAEHQSNLFNRFFYLGVTRAATYLGITCESMLPSKLEFVRGFFSTGGW